MLKKIKTLPIFLFLTLAFFACKEEQKIEEELPPLYEEYRQNLVGTYLCVCTRTHTGPWYPGFISTTDTTDVDVEKEISFDSTEELNENGKGFIKINGGGYSISPKDDEGHYIFSGPPAHLGFNGGIFYGTPDSMYISHGWSGSPSNSAEYSYRCRGQKIQ